MEKNMREKTCCFTGHRVIPARSLPALAKELEQTLRRLIGAGVRYFGAGGALGFDTLAAETVLRLKGEYPGIRLILVLPCRDQTRGWREADVRRYRDILRRADKVVYTGPIDAYFGYRLGALEYRSVRFETEVLDTGNYQGNAVVNYTDAETPYTRIIEHKHFEFGAQPKTVISREYSAEWKVGDEPYYPVNDEKNGALYARYKALAGEEKDVRFGGRLGEYRYYDMDKVIESALAAAREELA